jgi:hypothetical protein
MPIQQQLDTHEMILLSPNLFDQASSLKKSLVSPRGRKSTTKFGNLMSPRLHSPAKQLETNLIKIRISKFIVDLQRKQLSQKSNTLVPPSLDQINERYNSPAVFSLSPKMSPAMFSLSPKLSPAMSSLSLKAEAEELTCFRLNSKAEAFTPVKKVYVPPHKRDGFRSVQSNCQQQQRLRLVPWFHTLNHAQKQEHNRKCAALRILHSQQKRARKPQRV